jgi:hypothetical protein
MLSLIRELLQCKHSDPNRRRSGAGRWLTVNVPAELWIRLQAAAEIDASACDPDDLEALADKFTTSHTLRGGVPFDRIPTLVRAAHTAGRLSMRAEITNITDKIRDIKP